MRRSCLGIAGVVLALTFTGCGESEPEGGPIQYKGTNSAEIDKQLDVMAKNQKNKVFTTKQAEPKPAENKPAATTTKPADKKE
jgi:hypothetical protein